jgi:mono/diheme cytochrome c family protein
LLIAGLPFADGSMLSADAKAAELDRREQAMVSTVSSKIKRAAQNYFDAKYEAAGNDVRKALEQVDRAIGQGNPDVYRALQPQIDQISKAHALLELEGISLPPFERPEQPPAKMASEESGDSKSGDKPDPPGIDPSMLVSFTEEVAPILNRKCGRCHVAGSRGGFNLGTYAALMKGPPEGVVVFAGDVVGSRLIETIRTGDMPRGGGRVTPAEMETLTKWIEQGAQFDGQDPNASIASATAAPAEPETPMPKITQATGKETVSFVSDVAPVLVENCSGCHINAMQTRGGLRMDTFTQLISGGDSGPMIVPGRGEASLLVKKLRGTATDGTRMPAGGRPPLDEDEISLISKWIDEGATVDADPSRSIEVLSRLAWAANASSEELSKRRAKLAGDHFRLANASAAMSERMSDHFRVVGSGSEATLELVTQYAEQQLKSAQSVARPASGASPEDYFRGRATIFVFPRRYDYSEFAKMAEQRSIPSDWTSHWSFDGIDAYIAVVATDRESEEEIERRLLAPVISLAVATRGMSVPRWFAEGIGEAMSLSQNATTREEKQKLQSLAAQAASNVKDAKAFLNNRLTPEQTDSFGAAVAMTMLERNRRRQLTACLRSLAEGASFEQAFLTGFGVTPEAYINQYLQYVK